MKNLIGNLVYGHRCEKTKNIVYIGIASYEYGPKSTDRPTSISSRSPIWKKYMIDHDFKYNIEYLYIGLSRDKAIKIEKELIKKYGRYSENKGTLLNISCGGGINKKLKKKPKNKYIKYKRKIRDNGLRKMRKIV